MPYFLHDTEQTGLLCKQISVHLEETYQRWLVVWDVVACDVLRLEVDLKHVMLCLESVSLVSERSHSRHNTVLVVPV